MQLVIDDVDSEQQMMVLKEVGCYLMQGQFIDQVVKDEKVLQL